MNPSEAQLAIALRRLAQSSRAAEFSADDGCFAEQLAWVRDRSPFAAACTTRRAGKTVGNEWLLLETALAAPSVTCMYIAQTRGVAEELMWRRLKRRNEEHSLGGKTNDTHLTIEFPNASRIRLGGAKDRREADKLRGPEKIALAIIDEAQNFRSSVLSYLIDDILEPSMLDVDGKLRLSGTPGALAAGYFYDVCHSPHFKPHFWTLHQNKFLGVDPAVFLKRIRDRRNISEADPTYQREYLGRWVRDENVLVFRYGPSAEYETIPTGGGTWQYCIGVDLGFEDRDAIAVGGWRTGERTVYLIEERQAPKQTITQLAAQVQPLVDQYKPRKSVWDFGGLGKKIAEEVRSRWTMPVEAADKTRKLEHIELLNGAMLAGAFKARKGGPFAEDCGLVQWDQDARAKGVRKVADDYHSDITDAVLYMFRACRAFMEHEQGEHPPGYVEPSEHLKAVMAEQRRMKGRDPLGIALGFED
ncbi:MAG TPA: hypothetical protein VJ860_20185 [Polyangia bacterium]|jgi:Terminase-like family.|nr:hypothetical protein [Polyangia bacterium]